MMFERRSAKKSVAGALERLCSYRSAVHNDRHIGGEPVEMCVCGFGGQNNIAIQWIQM